MRGNALHVFVTLITKKPCLTSICFQFQESSHLCAFPTLRKMLEEENFVLM